MKTVTFDETQWQLVPKEATDAMHLAGYIDKEDVCTREIYRSMLAAAPEPPSVQVDERAEFEKWALSNSTISLVRDADGDYRSGLSHMVFIAYCAGRAALPQPATVKESLTAQPTAATPL